MKSNLFTRVLKVFSIGAGGGAVLATWVGPKFIPWYYEPGAAMGITCRPSIEGALLKYQWAQIIGICLGGILAWIVFYGLFGEKDKPHDPLLD